MAYRARFNCPACGSPLEMQEGTISLRCQYCGLVMRVGEPGRILKYIYEGRTEPATLKFIVERYFKDKGELHNFRSLAQKLYYLPFYRFQGMAYALISERIIEEEEDRPSELPLISKTVFQQKCRHFDLTIPAFEEPAFGLESLGIRPEVVPVNIMVNEDFLSESVPVDISITPDMARQKSLAMFAFNLGFVLDGKECVISEMVGEGLSIIYHPVWGYELEIGGGIYTIFIDGLSKRVIRETSEAFQYQPDGKDLSCSAKFQPIPHKCPNCGVDFQTSEKSLVYYCSNCARLFIIDANEYKQIPIRCGVYEPGEGHFPFWRFVFSTGKGLDTVGAFAKILTGEIPLIARSKAKNRFFLYVPAFTLPDLDSLTTRGLRLCRTQPEVDIVAGEIKPLAEAVLPESEAVELGRYYWNVIKSRYRFLDDEQFEFKIDNIGRGELVWLTMPGATPKERPQGRERAVFNA